ncbi:MAG: monofunctional biosynthetic peptidoglycan transglycosylase, partial [Hyphomicrobiaceae bacterium]
AASPDVAFDRFTLEMPHRAAVVSPFALRPGQREPALSFSSAAPPAIAADQAVGPGEPRTLAPSPAGTAESAATAGHEAIRRDGGERPTSRQWLRFAVRVVAALFAIWLVASVLAIALFRFVDPPGSMLMAQQRLGGVSIRQTFVPIARISPNLVHAVVASEDSRFCRHWGIDPEEVAAAIERARDGVPRGASTITMQVAKNLFLWPSKSYVRKALEVPLTLAIEAMWSKRRIIEVYLNIAEWGPGVFGAEAAAQHHFRKAASALSRREAALLAVSLPNPIQRSAGKPGAGLSRLARIIEARMRHIGPAARCTGV